MQSRFNPRALRLSAVDFSRRSPYETRNHPGLPPRDVPVTTGVAISGAGIVSYQGHPLRVAPVETIPQQAITLEPSATYDPSQYGDEISIPVVFAGVGEVIALRRPNETRINLLVQNLTVLGNIHYAFDRQADNLSCAAIGAGGNRLWDSSVPQGDLHIFSTGAGIAIVTYINKNISRR